MDAAFRRELQQRRERALDMRAAMADDKSFAAYLNALKPKS